MRFPFISLPLIYIRLLSFWVLVFFLERLLHVLYFIDRLPSSNAIDILNIFSNSIRLDLSMAAYLVSFPLIIGILHLFVGEKFRSKLIFDVYQYVFTTILLFIGFVNLNLYREWGTKINYKALSTFYQFPYEVAISGFTIALLMPFLMYIILGFLVFKLNKVFNASINPQPFKNKIFQKIFLSITLLGINILFIRGGWQLTPINVSMAQYSTIPVYNHLSTNTQWQLMQNIYFELKPLKSRYIYFSENKVKELLHEEKEKESTISILKPTVKDPNIVLIILESFTADLIESLGGESGITPNMEKIIKQGVLFKNIYSSGDRTERGIIAILSSFPSQATRSIIRDSQKQTHLPSISQELKKKNYHTSFYYGGESEFFGLKSYLLTHDFDDVVDKNVFNSKDFNSKWGAHDGVLFERHLMDLPKFKQPFFTTILTLSNHEPFEIPIPQKYPGNSLSDLFRNTAYYTDLCLGDYFRKAKLQPWYDNTLFVIIADHGHRLPSDKYQIWDYQRHRIPLLFYGNVLREEARGTTKDVYGSQTDVAQTIYNQLNIKAKPNYWSKDLLSSSSNKRFAFYNWDNGFGLVGNDFTLSYDESAKKLIDFKTRNPEMGKDEKLNFAKAYMQKIFSQYMGF